VIHSILAFEKKRVYTKQCSNLLFADTQSIVWNSRRCPN